MTKITTINKQTLIALRPQIDEALAELGERLGLKLSAGSGAFGGESGHFKLEIKVDDPAVQEAARRAEFERYCQIYDLEPSDFGLEFTAQGKRYRLTGLAMNRSKYPIRVFDIAADKEVLFSSMVTAHIKLARPAKVDA